MGNTWTTNHYCNNRALDTGWSLMGHTSSCKLPGNMWTTTQPNNEWWNYIDTAACRLLCKSWLTWTQCHVCFSINHTHYKKNSRCIHIKWYFIVNVIIGHIFLKMNTYLNSKITVHKVRCPPLKTCFHSFIYWCDNYCYILILNTLLYISVYSHNSKGIHTLTM